MNLKEAIAARHSVRAYLDTPIPQDARTALQSECDRLNEAHGLHMQLVFDEPAAFSGFLAHYGKFSGVRNYIAVCGKPGETFEDRAGYAGEALVLLAQTLNLNTCWVALTFSKGKARYTLADGEKLLCVIALGYGATQGRPHPSKMLTGVSDYRDGDPVWYRAGLDAALLAPTATNQQRFYFRRRENTVGLSALPGPYAKLDKSIVRLHFEIGAGKDSFVWED